MRKTKKTLAILAIVAMVLTMIPLQVFAATTSADDATRLGGVTRIDTAIAIADAGFPNGADTVIVAPADDANVVDALAAAPLAGKTSPILLASKNGSDIATVKAEITKLGAKNVYLIGAAANDTIANALSGVTVTKLAGADRTATAAAINAKLSDPAGTFVVGYNGTPDALSVASYAAANNYAIVLANPNGSADTSKIVGAKTYLVGGTGVVQDLAGATRLAGNDRYLTNKAVVNGLTYSYDKVYVANGVSLVDALAAAPLAAQANAPVLLTDGISVAAAADVNTQLTSTSQVIALGGTGVVSDAVKGNVAYNAPAALAINSVSAVTSKQVKVTLNEAVDPVTYANFTVDNGNTVIDATLDSTGKVATLDLSSDMIDGTTYNFTVTGATVKGVAQDDITSPLNYAVATLSSVSFSKTSFTSGDNITDFLVVKDSTGLIVSNADYTVTGIESSNENAISPENDVPNAGDKAGDVLETSGTVQIRVTIEYKDGSSMKTDLIPVTLTGSATGTNQGFALFTSMDNAYPDTVTYNKKQGDLTPDYIDGNGNQGDGAKTFLYEDDAPQYLATYFNDSNNDPQNKPLDLTTTADKYTVTSSNPAIVSVSQDDVGGALLTPISTGTATITVKKNNSTWKQTFSVPVKADMTLTNIIPGSTSVTLSDLADEGDNAADTNGANVSYKEISLKWVDQLVTDPKTQYHNFGYGTPGGDEPIIAGRSDAFETGTLSDNEDSITWQNVAIDGDKVVVSSTAWNNSDKDKLKLIPGKHDGSATDNNFTVEAVDGKTISNATVKISYYTKSSDTTPAKVVPITVTVVDVDKTKIDHYGVSVSHSAIDVNAKADVRYNSAGFKAYAYDSNNHVLDNVTDNLKIALDSDTAKSVASWFNVADADNSDFSIDGQTLSFADAATTELSKAGTVKVECALDDNGPFTVQTINYTNSSSSTPDSAVVSTAPVLVDLSKLPDNQIGMDQLLFGAVKTSELVLNNADPADASLAVKQGADGYYNAPAISFKNNAGTAVSIGDAIQNFDISKTSGDYFKTNGADGAFDVEYSVTGVKNLGTDFSSIADNYTADSLNNIKITSDDITSDSGTVTIVVKKVYVNGDDRSDNNLLASPTAFTVTFVN